MSNIHFIIPGEPKGKGRPRFARMGKFTKTYSPAETVNFENWVKLCFQQAMRANGFEMIPAGVPIAVSIISRFSWPQSMSQKKRQVTPYVTKKPDWDNIGKAISDALNGIAYHDDSQIADGSVKKVYCDTNPRIEVTITTM